MCRDLHRPLAVRREQIMPKHQRDDVHGDEPTRHVHKVPDEVARRDVVRLDGAVVP